MTELARDAAHVGWAPAGSEAVARVIARCGSERLAFPFREALDVNLNVYTQSSVESRAEALDTLESAFVN